MQITDEMRAVMTEEELAAINDEQSPEELAALKAIAEGGDDDNDDEDGQDEGEADTAGAGDGGDDGAATADAGGADQPGSAGAANAVDAGNAGDGTAVTDEPDTGARKVAAPALVVELPADFDAQVKAAADERAALAQQFKDGDIDFDEYNAKLHDVDAKSRSLESLKLKHEIAQDMAIQQQRQEFNEAVIDVAKRAKSQGIDYAKDLDKQADLDRFAQAIGDKNPDKSFAWVLNEAHKRVCILHDVPLEKPSAAAKDPAPKPADKAAAQRKPKLDNAPATLAQVPGGDGPGDVASEFADLDRLTGDALEDAIGQMAKRDPAKYQRYMAGM